jgi:hypothetical protein
MRHEASRHFKKKEEGISEDKMYELSTNSKSKNIKDLYRGISEFKRGYKIRSNVVKDENGDLLTDSTTF